MLKTNLTQICLPNGSLKEFNKYMYIYRKPVNRELWRRNVLNTMLQVRCLKWQVYSLQSKQNAGMSEQQQVWVIDQV